MSEVQTFQATVRDMVCDLLISFPEMERNMDANLRVIKDSAEGLETAVSNVKRHCTSVFPKRFFDILYENSDMFSADDGSCEFLPGVDYAVLWKANLSDTTRKTIWKYLQMLLFSSVADITDKSSFGEAANLFSAIDDAQFKEKLEETMAGMKSVFAGSDTDDATGPTLPDVSEIHSHVSEMMGGKLGSLAKEVAEQTLADMGEEFSEDSGSNAADIFSKLIRDPAKLMEMVKNVGTQLDQKIKNGEIKESELLEEASGLLKQMHKLPGMEHMKDMFKQMGVSNMNSAQSARAADTLRKRTTAAKTREKMRDRLAKRQAAKLMEEALRTEREQPLYSKNPAVHGPPAEAPNKKKKKKKKKKKPSTSS